MGKGKPTLVTTVSEFMEWASQFNQGGYLFRGVTNEGYDISASAYRRLKNTRDGDENMRVEFEKFVQINRGLIRDVRLRGLDRKDGRELRDLEILAELQHFRAATCLIDFTYNALIALYFACDQNSDNASECGKVVAVHTGQGHRFREVTLDLLKRDIDYFFLGNDGEMPPQFYKWQPPHQNSRIAAQQSIFLFGAAKINPDQECIILGSKKKEICESLEKVYGVAEAMLFPDFEGFARQHNQHAPYTQLAATQYRDRGLQKLREGEYEEAIAAFTEAIKVNPSKSSYYSSRGLAKQELLDQLLNQSRTINVKDYNPVIDDYTVAINLEPDAPTYILRARLRKREWIGPPYKVVPDLEKALKIARSLGHRPLITEIEELLREFQSFNDEDSENK